MKVKFKSEYYKISFKDKVEYDKKKICLFLKRLKRFMQRVATENLQLILVLVILIIFMSVIIPIGMIMNKYMNIFDGIWDFKNTILTTLVITFFINTVTIENQRHTNLIKQYYIYYSLKYYSECFINEILEILGYTTEAGDIFIEEDNAEYFKKQIEEIKKFTFNLSNNIEIKDYIIHSIRKFINNILYETNKLSRKEVIGLEEYDINDIIESLNEDILKIKYMKEKEVNEIFIKDYIINIVDLLYPLIAAYRRPWRWDIEVDIEMRKIIKEKGIFSDGNFNSLCYYDMPKVKKIKHSAK